MNINTKIITIKSVKNKKKIENNSNKRNIINENLYYIESELYKYNKNELIDFYLKKIINHVINKKKININFLYNEYEIRIENENHKNIILIIRSKQTKNNNINFNICFEKLDANLSNVSYKNKNIFFDVKEAIIFGIDICKRLSMLTVSLSDKTTFDCIGTATSHNLSMPLIHILQSGKTWYQNYFEFNFLNDKNALKFYNTIHKLKDVNVGDVINKIPEFQEFINANNINVTKKHGKVKDNILLFIYFYKKHFSEKQCNILSNKKIIEKLVKTYELEEFKNVSYQLRMENWNFTYI